MWSFVWGSDKSKITQVFWIQLSRIQVVQDDVSLSNFRLPELVGLSETKSAFVCVYFGLRDPGFSFCPRFKTVLVFLAHFVQDNRNSLLN